MPRHAHVYVMGQFIAGWDEPLWKRYVHRGGHRTTPMLLVILSALISPVSIPKRWFRRIGYAVWASVIVIGVGVEWVWLPQVMP